MMLVLVTAIIVPIKKMTISIKKPLRWPNAAMIYALRSCPAVIVAMKAVAIHCAWSWPTPKAPITLGTATFAMVAESTIAMTPVMPVKITNHR